MRFLISMERTTPESWTHTRVHSGSDRLARRRRKTGDKDDDDAINDMQLRMAGGFGLLSGQGNLTSARGA